SNRRCSAAESALAPAPAAGEDCAAKLGAVAAIPVASATVASNRRVRSMARLLQRNDEAGSFGGTRGKRKSPSLLSSVGLFDGLILAGLRRPDGDHLDAAARRARVDR